MTPFVTLLLTFLVAIVPIVELKLAIPLGMGLAENAGITGMSPWYYFIAAFLGTCIPTVLILLYLKPVLAWLGRTKAFSGLANKLNAHFEKKAQKVALKAEARAERVKERALRKHGDKEWTEEELSLLAEQTERKRKRSLEFVKYLSLFLFVAVPLPLTGVWTGSAVAVFLNTKMKYSLPCIILGNLTAGLIVMFLSLAGFHFAGITIPI